MLQTLELGRTHLWCTRNTFCAVPFVQDKYALGGPAGGNRHVPAASLHGTYIPALGTVFYVFEYEP